MTDIQDSEIRKQQLARTKSSVAIVAIAITGVLLIAALSFFLPKSSPEPESHPLEEANSLTAEDLAAARESFKQALAKFEDNIQPILDNPELEMWQEKKIQQARLFKDKAIREFANGHYLSALAELESAVSVASVAKEQWQADFVQAISSGEKALAVGEISQAQLQLNKALKINPSSARAKALQQKVEVFPQVAQLKSAYGVSVVENNLEKQILLLQQIVALAPEQQDMKVALHLAQNNKKERVFQEAIQLGLKQLAEQNLKAAEAAYNKAKAIFPNRTELQLLGSKINKQETEYTLASVHTRLQVLKREDKWAAVSQLSAEAEVYFPTDAHIQQYKQHASAIIKLREQASDYIKRPHRLADDNVQSNAKLLIKKSVRYLADSPGLAREIKVIGQHIDKYNMTYPVIIRSDGKTQLHILGQQQIGPVRQKSIQLAEGEYRLEGRRKGYKNKLLLLTVKPNENNEVTLVCDERI